MFFCGRYLKGDKPSGKSYTFKTEDDVKPGDIVKTATARIVVTDEAVDMDFVKSWGEDRITTAEREILNEENDT